MCTGNRNVTAQSCCSLKKKFSIKHHLLCIDAEIKNEFSCHQDKREIHVVLNKIQVQSSSAAFSYRVTVSLLL